MAREDKAEPKEWRCKFNKFNFRRCTEFIVFALPNQTKFVNFHFSKLNVMSRNSESVIYHGLFNFNPNIFSLVDINQVQAARINFYNKYLRVITSILISFVLVLHNNIGGVRKLHKRGGRIVSFYPLFVPSGCIFSPHSTVPQAKTQNIRFVGSKDSRAFSLNAWISATVGRKEFFIKMNLGTKVEFSAFVLVMLQHFVLSDTDFYNKCPEFNPQNELDIELVSESWWPFSRGCWLFKGET